MQKIYYSNVAEIRGSTVLLLQSHLDRTNSEDSSSYSIPENSFERNLNDSQSDAGSVTQIKISQENNSQVSQPLISQLPFNSEDDNYENGSGIHLEGMNNSEIEIVNL